MKKQKRRPVMPAQWDPQRGLTGQQAKERLEAGWGNTQDRHTGRSGWQIFRDCCFTYFNLVFVLMAALMLAVGSSVLNLTFMVVVIVNTAIGCVQQLRNSTVPR